ncbi:MAG TPA: hypothetical protein VNJ52_10650 [Patescibacteria group bacterium]|nr:hypothetical protein [Patescibacteria group bacterium]
MDSTRKSPGGSGALRPPGPLEAPTLAFDLKTEIERLRGENAWQSGRNSKALVKQADFRIVLTVLQPQARIHEHKASGRISVQTVAGYLRMHAGGKIFDLPTGHLLALDRALPHDVEAVEDSAFLLTICWPEESDKN